MSTHDLEAGLNEEAITIWLGTWMHQQFAEFGGVELDIPPRDEIPPSIVTFGDEDDQA